MQRLGAAATLGASYTMARAAHSLGVQRERGEAEVDYLTRAVWQYAGKPMEMENAMRQSLYGMPGALPEAYYPTVNAAQRAVDFLSTKVPPPSQDPFEPTTPERMSIGQEAELQSYTEAIWKPGKILDEMRDGTLKTETIDAVRAVYPEFYREVTGKVLEELASRKLKLSQAQQVDVALLLGRPLTYGLQNLDTMQTAVQMARSQDGQDSQPRKSTGPSKTATLAMSGSQELQARRREG